MSHTQQHIAGFCSAKEIMSYSLKALANQGALNWIPAFAGMTGYVRYREADWIPAPRFLGGKLFEGMTATGEMRR